jgi:DNA-binding MarR family transcriptional regulator
VNRGLGTQLRHLLELLDGAVHESYAQAGLGYRPRYTPVMRALIDQGACSVCEIAQAAGITQPAATQTVALMVRDGLVEMRQAEHDARVRLLRLTRKGSRLVPRLQTCWRATEVAARSLDNEMTTPLSEALAEAIHLLNARPFGDRIARARRQARAPVEAHSSCASR